MGKNKKEIKKAYKYAIINYQKKIKKEEIINLNNLNKNKIKILIVSHPYNTYDENNKDIINYLKNNDIELIYSDKIKKCKYSKAISKDLYFKYSKDNLGALVYCQDKINGVIFISAFPCALDSLANEIAMRKIKKPYINLILDDNLSFTALETRLESFIDVLKGETND